MKIVVKHIHSYGRYGYEFKKINGKYIKKICFDVDLSEIPF
jgi:hypothetical protein